MSEQRTDPPGNMKPIEHHMTITDEMISLELRGVSNIWKTSMSPADQRTVLNARLCKFIELPMDVTMRFISMGADTIRQLIDLVDNDRIDETHLAYAIKLLLGLGFEFERVEDEN